MSYKRKVNDCCRVTAEFSAGHMRRAHVPGPIPYLFTYVAPRPLVSVLLPHNPLSFSPFLLHPCITCHGSCRRCRARTLREKGRGDVTAVGAGDWCRRTTTPGPPMLQLAKQEASTGGAGSYNRWNQKLQPAGKRPHQGHRCCNR